MIEVKNLTKRYGKHTAVDDISFTIDKGKIYGFLGPNGAGKSTTMNILTGYLAASEGDVIINGHDIFKEPEEAKKSVGYLPEIPPVYMDMTVTEYLAFAAELKGIEKEQRQNQCTAVIKQLELTDVKDRLISNLSKGYRQRVGVAQALLGFPETIIMDEPMVGLDPQQIMEMRGLIRSLAKNHTVIMSSHILGEVRETCDHLLIISKGKLVASDTPEALEEKYCRQDSVTVEAKGDPKDVAPILDRVAGIRSVNIEKKGENCIAHVEPGNEQIRRDIFNAFAREYRPLLSLYRQKPSLEEVYLSLVEEGRR